jgi:cobalt-zinc-cadmium efflux system membrane fusion protein
MYATVRVAVESDPQPALPSDALRSDAQGSFVVLALGDRTFRRQYVDADASADGVVAVPALQPDARVVTTGAFQIVSAMGGGG